MTETDEALVAYVPVIHTGYVDLFRRHDGADMYVLDRDVLAEFPDLRKDIRALAPSQSRLIVERLDIFPTVQLLGKSALQSVEDKYDSIIMPNDEVSRMLKGEYFGAKSRLEPVFLRWDRTNVRQDVELEPDREVIPDARQHKILDTIYAEAAKSSDIWRGVGAVIVTADEEMLSAHNTHVPTEYTPWIDGDPRSFAKRGTDQEITTDAHAEAILIAYAAANGIPLQGAELHIGTVCCSLCAKQVAAAGIKTCYYVSGHASLDGATTLRNAGVELVRYIFEPRHKVTESVRLRPYPEKPQT